MNVRNYFFGGLQYDGFFQKPPDFVDHNYAT